MKWKNIETKSRLKNLPLPDKEKLWEKVYSSYLNGFKCEYCGQQMLVKDAEYPYSRSFSLDHKTSIFLGGDNSLENFAVVCHRCNIIKGTMKAETFKELLQHLLNDPNLLNRVFEEIWAGRLADKLQREESLSLEEVLWNVSRNFQDEAWLPITCPKCLGIVSNKMASDRLVCLKCGSEFFLVEVSTKKGDD
jgi:DNA-directed RNA polymerase subunit RPC12/RpoP